MKKLKKINKQNPKKIFKIMFITILILLVIIMGFLLYNYYKEQENIKIDEYNFEQLEKILRVLDKLDKKSYNFSNLQEFNNQFNQDIKPAINCYFLSSKEDFFGKSNYLFLFEIYSKKYKSKYNNIYYIYPESISKLINESLCAKNGGICRADVIFSKYMETISNPCRD